MSLEGNERKHGRLRATIVVLLVVTVAGVIGFKWFTTATPVSETEALQIFDENNAAAGPQEIADGLKGKGGPHRGKGSRKPGAKGSPRAGEARSGKQARVGSPRGAASVEAGSASVAEGPMAVPAEGVYAYRTDGGERISGYEFRRFPSRSYRNVVHTGSRSWVEHHTFLREHQGWSSFRLEEAAVLTDWTRQRVEFGPVVEDELLEFHTPLPLTWLPWESGRSWEGAVEGETDDGPFQGSFSASTGAYSRIQVGDEVVGVWLEEMSFVLHGVDFDASVDLRRWTSPELGVTVREEVVADARKGALTYTAEWSLDLLSTDPER
ncbi:MAG TPA: hypothetical protein VNC78_01895 [Actinomycetota bacterium]|nr:hypothetical protein [Actinomycetota bacterium]